MPTLETVIRKEYENTRNKAKLLRTVLHTVDIIKKLEFDECYYLWYDYLVNRVVCSAEITTPSMFALVDTLETLENAFECEVSSWDNNGTRVFEFNTYSDATTPGVRFHLYAIPDEKGESSDSRRCRRVCVGEETTITHNPKFEIRCD